MTNLQAFHRYNSEVKAHGGTALLGWAVGYLGAVANHYGTTFWLKDIQRTETEQQIHVDTGVGVRDSTHLWGGGADLAFKNSTERNLFGAWWKWLGFTWGGDFREPEPWHFDIRRPQ